MLESECGTLRHQVVVLSEAGAAPSRPHGASPARRPKGDDEEPQQQEQGVEQWPDDDARLSGVPPRELLDSVLVAWRGLAATQAATITQQQQALRVAQQDLEYTHQQLADALGQVGDAAPALGACRKHAGSRKTERVEVLACVCLAGGRVGVARAGGGPGAV